MSKAVEAARWLGRNIVGNPYNHAIRPTDARLIAAFLRNKNSSSTDLPRRNNSQERVINELEKRGLLVDGDVSPNQASASLKQVRRESVRQTLHALKDTALIFASLPLIKAAESADAGLPPALQIAIMLSPFALFAVKPLMHLFRAKDRLHDKWVLKEQMDRRSMAK